MFNAYLANTAIADVGFFIGLITLTELNLQDIHLKLQTACLYTSIIKIIIFKTTKN